MKLIQAFSSVVRARVLAIVGLLAASACDKPEEIAVEPIMRVLIVSPADGEVVQSPFVMRLKTVGFDVVESEVPAPRAGYLMIALDGRCAEAGEKVSTENERLVHLKDGSLQTELSLPPGFHVLCVQAVRGDGVALAARDLVSVRVLPSELLCSDARC